MSYLQKDWPCAWLIKVVQDSIFHGIRVSIPEVGKLFRDIPHEIGTSFIHGCVENVFESPNCIKGDSSKQMNECRDEPIEKLSPKFVVWFFAESKKRGCEYVVVPIIQADPIRCCGTETTHP